ncbi:hypothetical protein BJ085DRAFT_28775 [Dimargaris cristalligena]|uniref:Uncharacterized protein n=1 Tax=Dimargaris cristalligena TaxID=215637 RepID=A0A4P9ZS40_9FUNG|nr:hypothetical protein BJ085DRAFT_28775 [Dimargaris cristalligena]|eukprot:RKP35492.1 hypothetical protein BJ085DRAFT_28775 [Dimargaris cristalligena]
MPRLALSWKYVLPMAILWCWIFSLQATPTRASPVFLTKSNSDALTHPTWDEWDDLDDWEEDSFSDNSPNPYYGATGSPSTMPGDLIFNGDDDDSYQRTGILYPKVVFRPTKASPAKPEPPANAFKYVDDLYVNLDWAKDVSDDFGPSDFQPSVDYMGWSSKSGTELKPYIGSPKTEDLTVNELNQPIIPDLLPFSYSTAVKAGLPESTFDEVTGPKSFTEPTNSEVPVLNDLSHPINSEPPIFSYSAAVKVDLPGLISVKVTEPKSSTEPPKSEDPVLNGLPQPIITKPLVVSYSTALKTGLSELTSAKVTEQAQAPVTNPPKPTAKKFSWAIPDKTASVLKTTAEERNWPGLGDKTFASTRKNTKIQEGKSAEEFSYDSLYVLNDTAIPPNDPPISSHNEPSVPTQRLARQFPVSSGKDRGKNRARRLVTATPPTLPYHEATGEKKFMAIRLGDLLLRDIIASWEAESASININYFIKKDLALRRIGYGYVQYPEIVPAISLLLNNLIDHFQFVRTKAQTTSTQEMEWYREQNPDMTAMADDMVHHLSKGDYTGDQLLHQQRLILERMDVDFESQHSRSTRMLLRARLWRHRLTEFSRGLLALTQEFQEVLPALFKTIPLREKTILSTSLKGLADEARNLSDMAQAAASGFPVNELLAHYADRLYAQHRHEVQREYMDISMLSGGQEDPSR